MEIVGVPFIDKYGYLPGACTCIFSNFIPGNLASYN